MSVFSGDPQAIVVLPPGAHGRVADPPQRRWLARGRLHYAEPSRELFLRVLQALGQPPPETGLAALRLWGQTGKRPDAWVAAADPVYLEAMLNHVRVHALGVDELPQQQLWRLFDALQREFGDHGDQCDHRALAFASVGSCGYLRGAGAIATAAVSADCVHLAEPAEFLPQGDAAGSHDQLIGELQLYLHAHPVNEQRRQAGLRPINSLWLWGGGESPQVESRHPPPLFADDPLYTGYWRSSGGQDAPWPASLMTCLETAPDGFVAVCPAASDAAGNRAMHASLETLRVMLSRGELCRVTLFFRDGLGVDLRRRDALRFWRRVPQLLTDGDAG